MGAVFFMSKYHIHLGGIKYDRLYITFEKGK